MEYISHSHFKKLLNEMHTMDHDGVDEFHKLPADHEEGLEKEGNAFTAGLAKTKHGGEFKVGDKEFKDTSHYDAHMSEDDISKDIKGAAYHIGDKVDYKGHSFTIVIGPGGKATLKHSTGRLLSPEESIKVLKQAAISKKFHDLDEYQFDQMYPDDPGPFEAKHKFDDIEMDTPHAHKLKVNAPNYKGTIFKNEDGTYELYDIDGWKEDKSLPPFKSITDLMKYFDIKMDDLYEDAVNWDAVDDMEADANQTDDGIEEGFNPDTSDFEQAIASELQYLGHDELSDEEYEKAIEALENPKVVSALRGVHPQKAAAALVKMVRNKEVGEGINSAPMQATGPTIQTVEESGVASLTSEEKEQVKQYIESIKTIKEQIAKLVNKGKMKESGDTTGLVMKPSTVSEKDEMAQGGIDHEKIESQLDPKFHEAFHKITGMIIGDLLKAGFPEDQIKSFLDHEIEEKAKEWVSGQYGENKLRK